MRVGFHANVVLSCVWCVALCLEQDRKKMGGEEFNSSCISFFRSLGQSKKPCRGGVLYRPFLKSLKMSPSRVVSVFQGRHPSTLSCLHPCYHSIDRPPTGGIHLGVLEPKRNHLERGIIGHLFRVPKHLQRPHRQRIFARRHHRAIS